MIKSLLRALKPDAARPAERAPGTPLIDVKQLIAELSDDELLRSADAYFARMTLASEQCRKPFSNPDDSIYLTRHLSLLIEAADLHRGDRVLELGCGTGWLCLGLAQMGCHAVGVDISPAALALARQLADAHAGARPGSVEFLAYDGKALPLPDASVDRIVCFDAFHHVRDQAATLAEFARVLKHGGRVAFFEPGPHHSKTPLSQAEMANHTVIENDVSMPEIARHAQAAGFDVPQMLLQFQQPFTLPVDEFNAWARDGIPRDRRALLLHTLQTQMTNGQCFFLYKGQPTRDSRRADGLAARLELLSVRRVPLGDAMGLRMEVRAHNTGARDWIAAAGPGQVNLGVQVLSPGGKMLDNNFARLRLPEGPVAPGETVTIVGHCREPEQTDYRLQLDLVAELVAWFSDLGRTQPLQIAADRF